jgi:predicted dehydrogenase
MIRVGLIGAGFMGRNHFNQYERMAPKARIVALCDKEADRRSGDWSKVGGNIADAQGTVRDLTGIKQYADWKELVADPDVDLVDICVPTYLHAEMSIVALKAGKHVLCEKPMALTVEQCDEMLAVAKQAKGRFMIAQCLRFWPECVFVKQVIDDRRYGELRSLHLQRQASTPDYSLNNWLLDPKLSGCAILDLHVHDSDYALWMLGKPKAVHAQAYQRIPGAYDRVHSLWDYGPERVVQMEGAWDLPPAFAFNMGITAVFEKAAVIWELKLGKPLTVMTMDGKTETPTVGPNDGYYNEIEYFLGCVERNEAPKTSTPQQSRDAVMIALAEKQSAITGKVVPIE